MRKYEFTGETKKTGIYGNITVGRIRAVVDFGTVKAGELGGWIEKEENLHHRGDGWVYGDAIVYGNAWVWGNAKVCGNAIVCDNAKIRDNAEVCDNAKVYGNAKVFGNAKIRGNAKVYGNAKVCGNAIVCGNAKVYDNAEVCDNAKVYDAAEVYDAARVYGSAKVCGNAEVCGNAKVSDNAKVVRTNDVLVIGAIGSRNDFTTFYRDKDNEITVKCGCFLGKIDGFLKRVRQTHGDSKHALVYRAAAELAKMQIDTDGGSNDEGI